MVKAIKKSSVKSVILIGEMARALGANLKLKTKNEKLQLKIKNLGFTSMKEIVKTAQKEAKPGDIVLLSPGCASFDMFKNASDRGRQFKEAVKD
jgi:UDP-N-acetylmuramoylalanine--D-glutamate ligase